MTENRNIINIEEALKRVRGKHSILKKMLTLFLQSKEFTSFEDALTGEDYSRAAEVIHAIKGITGNLSMDLLFEISTQLMHQLRDGPPNPQLLDAYRDALIKTKAVVEDTIATIE